jgi:predicted RNase H-like HicB family nuclease
MVLRYYPALIGRDEGVDGYGVVFPDFPGCVSGGDTVQEAALNAAEALAMHVEGMVEADDQIPAPSAIDAPLPDWLAGVPGHTAAAVMVPVEIPGRVVRANITVDEALLARVDRAAAAEGSTRSGFLAQAAREKLAKLVS